MSLPVAKPCFIAGTPRSSGDVQTGELQHVRGGGRNAVIWSGALAPSLACCPGAVSSGGQVLLYSGAGRLNSILPHMQMISGLPAFFYDAGTVAGSGVGVSGQWLIGLVPPTWRGGQQGSGAVDSTVPFNGEPIRPEMPFHSGLCVSCPSGAPGFTVSYTPEVNTNFANA